MRGWIAIGVLGMAGCCAAQQGCYRSAMAAAAAAGTQDAKGFRVESVRYDAFSRAGWAMVRNCAHPEWPGQMVRVAGVTKAAAPMVQQVVRAAVALPPLVVAGTRVRVVKLEAAVRMELTGVAQASARAGEQVEVRLLTDGDREQFVAALVRGDGSVEMDGR